MTDMAPLNRIYKGKYTSVWHYMHTYGTYGMRFQTWTQVRVNRLICKIIARDLTLMARRWYWIAMSQLESCVTGPLSPNFGADRVDCINRTTEYQLKRKKVLCIHATYVVLPNLKSWYQSVVLATGPRNPSADHFLPSGSPQFGSRLHLKPDTLSLDGLVTRATH
jgi:hypothetical protein